MPGTRSRREEGDGAPSGPRRAPSERRSKAPPREASPLRQLETDQEGYRWRGGWVDAALGCSAWSSWVVSRDLQDPACP